jgi:hypothetical protein
MAAVGQLERCPEALGGVDRPHRCAHLGTGNVRRRGLGTSRIHKLVEALKSFAPGLEVTDGHGAGVEIDLGDLAPSVDVDAGFAELVRAAADQSIGIVEQAADVIRNPARRVGRVGPALERDHHESGRTPSRDRRGAHPGRVPANDHQPSGRAHLSPIRVFAVRNVTVRPGRRIHARRESLSRLEPSTELT